jgi:hypothetical protein
MGGVLPQSLPRARIDFVLQEIGTYPTRTVLRALREENRYHHALASAVDARHPVKLALLEALCPDSASWRKRAVVHGMSALNAAARWVFRETGETA